MPQKGKISATPLNEQCIIGLTGSLLTYGALVTQWVMTRPAELTGTKAYEQTSKKEKSVINNHIFHNATRFAVSVNEDQERLPTFYWLPKLHKKHIRLDLLLILAHARLPNYQNC